MTDYKPLASVLKHSEGGMTQRYIKSLAKQVGVKVQVYPSHFVGHHGISIDKKATEKQEQEMLEGLGLD